MALRLASAARSALMCAKPLRGLASKATPKHHKVFSKQFYRFPHKGDLLFHFQTHKPSSGGAPKVRKPASPPAPSSPSTATLSTSPSSSSVPGPTSTPYTPPAGAPTYANEWTYSQQRTVDLSIAEKRYLDFCVFVCFIIDPALSRNNSHPHLFSIPQPTLNCAESLYLVSSAWVSDSWLSSPLCRQVCGIRFIVLIQHVHVALRSDAVPSPPATEAVPANNFSVPPALPVTPSPVPPPSAPPKTAN